MGQLRRRRERDRRPAGLGGSRAIPRSEATPERGQPTLILGLDPGSRYTGFGLVARQGQRLRALAWGRLSCPRADPLALRLSRIAGELEDLLAQWHPQTAVLESPFHGASSRALIVLSQARGALLAVLGRHGLEVCEYSPAEVKSAVTGNGRADKRQVARMVQILLGLDTAGTNSDATDALALAICYAQRGRLDRLVGR